MKIKILLSLMSVLVLGACTSTMKHTWKRADYNGKSFNSILVIAITKNLEARTTFENTIVEELKKQGINASNSLDVFPPILNVADLSEEEIASKIMEGNYDAVIASSLIKEDSRDVKEVATGAYYGPGMYGYGGYRGYIRYGYGFAYTPEYYRQEKSYILETRLFDVEGANPQDAIVWTGQSSLIDPSSYYSGAKEYARKLVKTLVDDNVIQ
ncbi:hypothetical protein [Mangrovibacterium lignilyticum]|uniref:hypothetical protein n=1 Tax=Mangrovibacterium lignilyticum TaxID=2668052 RepID=UPI0013D74880|nr:hypothetical protein [Mangrovibacterium lignilyticum]